MSANKDTKIAVEAAIALAEKTAATAEALASAKVQSDIKTAEMALDISYIKRDIGEIKDTFKVVNSLYIPKEEYFKEHKVLVDMVYKHEERIRSAELSITKIMTYGSVGVLAIGVIEFIILRFAK